MLFSYLHRYAQEVKRGYEHMPTILCQVSEIVRAYVTRAGRLCTWPIYFLFFLFLFLLMKLKTDRPDPQMTRLGLSRYRVQQSAESSYDKQRIHESQIYWILFCIVNIAVKQNYMNLTCWYHRIKWILKSIGFHAYTQI